MSENNMQVPIDFVVTWVDGNDPEWLEDKEKWRAKEENAPWSEWATGDKRYRDWGLLRYWFRAVEKYADWVNHVYFVTAGSVPEWLNVDCPKLSVVRHDEFIPKEYLPTFNSHCIEWNLHRIDGLSEQFVYFNDDMYLNSPVKPDFFFKGGLPMDYACLSIPKLTRKMTSYAPYSPMVLNDHWDMHAVIKENFPKWFAPCYGPKILFKNFVLSRQREFSGISTDHLPFPFLKSTFEELWTVEAGELDRNCSDRFRRFYGISPNLIRDWQRVEGRFNPCPNNRGKAWAESSFYEKDENLEVVLSAIGAPKYKMLCINDFFDDSNRYEYWGEQIRAAFEKKFPFRSIYEKRS